jgi:hypothetical protein
MNAVAGGPVPAEDQRCSDELSNLAGVVHQEIGALRASAPDGSKLALSALEGRIQEQFRVMRHYISELKISAEEQDT